VIREPDTVCGTEEAKAGRMHTRGIDLQDEGLPTPAANASRGVDVGREMHVLS